MSLLSSKLSDAVAGVGVTCTASSFFVLMLRWIQNRGGKDGERPLWRGGWGTELECLRFKADNKGTKARGDRRLFANGMMLFWVFLFIALEIKRWAMERGSKIIMMRGNHENHRMYGVTLWGLWTVDCGLTIYCTFLSDGGRTLNTTYEAYYSRVATLVVCIGVLNSMHTS